jgi:hypothetical protein
MDSTDHPTSEPANAMSRTRISFDLASVLSEEELAAFQSAAEAAGAQTLTEHFLDLTLRDPSQAA